MKVEYISWVKDIDFVIDGIEKDDSIYLGYDLTTWGFKMDKDKVCPYEE